MKRLLLVEFLELGLLVNAGLGVCDLVEAGNFEAQRVPALTFIHVVPKGQNHLQELAELPALDHLLRRQAES